MQVISNFVVLFFFLSMLGCGGGTDVPEMGTEGAPCYGNGSCNSGLVCNASNICEKESVDPCKDITCSGHGMCAISDGEPICACDKDYHAEDLSCIEDGTTGPCHGVTCSDHGTCADMDGQAICVCDDGYHAVDLTCVEIDPANPCDGVTCSGHGTCVDNGGTATCACDTGYHAENLFCIEDDPCDGVTCSGHGTCEVSGGNPICVCDTGYHAVSLTCIEDDPCDGVTCSGHGTCVNNGGIAECACDTGYHPEDLTCVEDSTCYTYVVNATNHILTYPGGVPNAVGGNHSSGTFDCSVTSSNASYGGGGTAMFHDVLYLNPSPSVIPTDGTPVTCGIGGEGNFRMMFVDDFTGDNSGSATVDFDGQSYTIDAQNNILSYPGGVPNSVGANLPSGPYTCRVTSSNASYGGGGTAMFAKVLFLNPSPYLIPTDGTPVDCGIGGEGNFRMMFVDGFTGDNSGSATVELCPAP